MTEDRTAPMHIKTLCLAAPRKDANTAGVLLRTAAQALLRSASGLAQVQHLRVLRHIPTDSVAADRMHTGVTAEADAIASVLELHFETPAAMEQCTSQLAWAAFREHVDAAAPILFSLDTLSNVPVPPRGAAVQGGFRRWMLLARKAETHEQFRDAWFGRHADLVRQLPHVDGYLQNLVIARHDAKGRAVPYEQMPIDGVAELCFADEAAMNASYASDARLPLRDDGRDLLGRINTLLVQGEAWT